MSNRFEESFQQFFDELVSRLSAYLSAIFDDDEVDEEWKEQIIELLSAVYVASSADEVLSILQQTDVMYDEGMINAITSQISSSSFVEDEKDRLGTIILANFKKLLEGARELKRDVSNSDNKTLKEEFMAASMYIMLRFATSEVHMTQEKASLHAGLLVEEVASQYLKEITENKQAEVVLYKTWHCHHDGKTCDVCLAMDGTRVRVDEAFLDEITDDFSGLDYTGGQITYAHPNCRCWVTYDAEEVIIKP